MNIAKYGIIPYFCRVKRKIFIFALFLVGLAVLAGRCGFIQENHTATDNAEMHGNEISRDDFQDNAYIKYNCAFCAPSGQLLGTQRNSSPSGHARTANFSRNRLQRTCNASIVFKDGKITGPAYIRGFQTRIDMFPSGKLSESHCFISLRKFVI